MCFNLSINCYLYIAAHVVISLKLSATVVLRFAKAQYANQFHGLLQPQG